MNDHYNALACEATAYARANAAEARVKDLEARLVEAGDAARVLVMHLQVSGFPSGVSTVRILAERVESLLKERTR